MTQLLAYSLTTFLQHVVNALSLGSVYALLALGVAAVFSVLGLINFAHGELVTIAGFTMLALRLNDVPWPVVVPVAVVAAGVAAIAMERVAFRPVRGAPLVTLLLTSLGLSLIIQNVLLFFYGARGRSLRLGEWPEATVSLGGVIIKWFDVATVITTAVALLLFTLFLRRSVHGLALRAAADDFTMTRLMGIRANAVVRGAFLVSGLLAGVASIFYLGTLGQIGYDYGFSPLLKGFVAAVIGGLGSLGGAVAGGFVLAALEIFFRVALPAHSTPFTTAIVFGIVAVVLLFRPQGLFGRSSGADRV
jgi:branched-chain amino acid transport system permease protein